jgi:protease-4
MKKRTKIILIGLVVLIGLPASFSALRKAATPAIGMIEISGPIMDSIEYLEIIKQFENDDKVKSVIVRLDSPGGKVGPSLEIYEARMRGKRKKPVIASMGSVSASGAYYIACSADTIYALPGTITGSIGVILEFFDVTHGLEKLGVSSRSITGGELKDAGSPFRPMTERERKYFQDLAIDIHDQFKEEVAKSRKIPRAKVDEYADGRIFTGRQALALGLIDKLGGLDRCVEDARKRAGIEGEPRIIEGRPSEGVWEELKRFAASHAPVGFGKGTDLISRGFLRIEYSIQ